MTKKFNLGIALAAPQKLFILYFYNHSKNSLFHYRYIFDPGIIQKYIINFKTSIFRCFLKMDF